MTEQTDGTIPVGSTKTSIGEKILPWVFRAPLIFMVLFFALPMAMTVVFSVFERTMFWMEPGFTLYSYENFFFSARLENFLKSMMYSLICSGFSNSGLCAQIDPTGCSTSGCAFIHSAIYGVGNYSRFRSTPGIATERVDKFDTHQARHH